MRVYLRHGVHMCLVDDGAIFLDLAANAYCGIDGATRKALTKCLDGLAEAEGENVPDLSSELPKEAQALVQRGLLTESQTLGRSFSPLNILMAHALPFGVGRRETADISITRLVRFSSVVAQTAILIRLGRLSILVTRLVALKARVSGSSPADWPGAVRLVYSHRRLSALFYSHKTACLLDSLVLTEMLIRAGHKPTLVLGVRTKPFLAHARVVMGDWVLNDSVEYARTLTPIAAF